MNHFMDEDDKIMAEQVIRTHAAIREGERPLSKHVRALAPYREGAGSYGVGWRAAHLLIAELLEERERRQPDHGTDGETYIDIVFDGPPDHDAPGFIEVENTTGHSIRVGEWIERPDGYWALRLPFSAGAVVHTADLTDLSIGVVAIARDHPLALVAHQMERVRSVGRGDNDDIYVDGELAQAAACYALPSWARTTRTLEGGDEVPTRWPWPRTSWRPSPDNRIKELVKAGQLIADEIARLQRNGT